MLQNLHVKNLALIDEVEITFDEHLNILTGETGAGKSVLIGSIESALGKKISKDMIRPGAKEAVIELLFWIEDQKLIKEIEAFDLEVEDGQIFIKRVINEKRSINKINDSTVTLNTLREVSRRLFDLHGQQEHQVLLKEKNHFIFFMLLNCVTYGKNLSVDLYYITVLREYLISVLSVGVIYRKQVHP